MAEAEERVVSTYPFAALLEHMAVSPRQAQVILSSSGEAMKRYTERGLTAEQADRLACRAGFHPAEVWPSWWEDAERAAYQEFRARKNETARRLYRASDKAEAKREKRRQYYAEAAEYERSASRRRYWSDPERERERKRREYAAKKAASHA